MVDISFSEQTFVDLGVSKEEAVQMTEILKPEETSRTMVSLQFIQFAKDIQKISGINLLKYNEINWESFSKFIRDVKNGVMQVSEKLKAFVVNFEAYATETVRIIIKKTYDNAKKVYSTVGKNVTQFLTYLTSTKVIISSIGMSDLHKAANEFINVDNRIQTLYNECYFSYRRNILSHIKENRILDIEAYHIDHILAMLADLSFLVDQAKTKYVNMMTNLKRKKNLLLQKKTDINKLFEKKIKTQNSRLKYGGSACAVGLFGLFMGILAIPAAIAVGIGAVCAGVGFFKKRSLKKQQEKEIAKVDEELRLNQQQIDFWKNKNVYAQLNVLAKNLKAFENQMNIIKEQYETKKNLQNCGDDIGLWLAKKNGHDKNVEKLAVYREFLNELCVDTYETFIEIEDNDIDEVFQELKSKHKERFLKQIKKVIVKYCHDKQLDSQLIMPFTRRS